MKIMTKTNDGRPACCLQKSEAFSLALRNLFPDSLLEELLEQDESVLLNRDTFTGLGSANGGYEFNVVILRKENIKWLAAQDWIVDYTKYGHMSSSKLRATKKSIEDSFLVQVMDFNARDKSYREKHYAEFGKEIVKKQHQTNSLSLLADFIDKRVDFVFPDEIYAEFRQGIFERIIDLFRFSHTA